MMKCRNCGEPMDEFIGIESKAGAYLHSIKIDANNKEGYLWGWSDESKQHCRNPEPEDEAK